MKKLPIITLLVAITAMAPAPSQGATPVRAAGKTKTCRGFNYAGSNRTMIFMIKYTHQRLPTCRNATSMLKLAGRHRRVKGWKCARSKSAGFGSKLIDCSSINSDISLIDKSLTLVQEWMGSRETVSYDFMPEMNWLGQRLCQSTRQSNQSGVVAGQRTAVENQYTALAHLLSQAGVLVPSYQQEESCGGPALQNPTVMPLRFKAALAQLGGVAGDISTHSYEYSTDAGKGEFSEDWRLYERLRAEFEQLGTGALYDFPKFMQQAHFPLLPQVPDQITG